MTALGQKQTSCSEIAMSALPPKADIAKRHWHVGFVPTADISQRTPMFASDVLAVDARKACSGQVVRTSILRCR
jgi:hypothetical protein